MGESTVCRGIYRESGPCVEFLLDPEVHTAVSGIFLLPLLRGYAADAAGGAPRSRAGS
jgi:hypothetical protein